MAEHFHVFVRGTRFEGTYEVDGPHLTIVTPYGSRRAMLGLMKPIKLARALFRAILRNVTTVCPPVEEPAVRPLALAH